MSDPLDHESASRIMNAWLGGDPSETLSSRVWRERWRRPWLWILLWHIDRVAVSRYAEPPGHCRRAAENHRLRRVALRLGAASPDDVLRLMADS